MERRLKGGNPRDLLLHKTGVHRHVVIEENFSLCDLYAFNLNNILIRVELNIIPQTNNRYNRTQLKRNLTPDHDNTI